MKLKEKSLNTESRVTGLYKSLSDSSNPGWSLGWPCSTSSCSFLYWTSTFSRMKKLYEFRTPLEASTKILDKDWSVRIGSLWRFRKIGLGPQHEDVLWLQSHVHLCYVIPAKPKSSKTPVSKTMSHFIIELSNLKVPAMSLEIILLYATLQSKSRNSMMHTDYSSHWSLLTISFRVSTVRILKKSSDTVVVPRGFGFEDSWRAASFKPHIYPYQKKRVGKLYPCIVSSGLDALISYHPTWLKIWTMKQSMYWLRWKHGWFLKSLPARCVSLHHILRSKKTPWFSPLKIHDWSGWFFSLGLCSGVSCAVSSYKELKKKSNCPRNNEFLLLPQELRLPIRIVPGKLLKGFPRSVDSKRFRETPIILFPLKSKKLRWNRSHLNRYQAYCQKKHLNNSAFGKDGSKTPPKHFHRLHRPFKRTRSLSWREDLCQTSVDTLSSLYSRFLEKSCV